MECTKPFLRPCDGRGGLSFDLLFVGLMEESEPQHSVCFYNGGTGSACKVERSDIQRRVGGLVVFPELAQGGVK